MMKKTTILILMANLRWLNQRKRTMKEGVKAVVKLTSLMSDSAL